MKCGFLWDLDVDHTLTECVAEQGKCTYTMWELSATIQKCQSQTQLEFTLKQVNLNSLSPETQIIQCTCQSYSNPTDTTLRKAAQIHKGTDPFLMHLTPPFHSLCAVLLSYCTHLFQGQASHKHTHTHHTQIHRQRKRMGADVFCLQPELQTAAFIFSGRNIFISLLWRSEVTP